MRTLQTHGLSLDLVRLSHAILTTGPSLDLVRLTGETCHCHYWAHDLTKLSPL